MTQKNLKDIILENKTYYESIGRVWSPILNSYIHFTSEGRIHLTHKSNRGKRTVKEQYYKLRLFPLVIPALKNSTNIQAWRFQGDESNPHNVQHYAITCIVGRKNPINLRVIIKRTGDGQFNYHSVMEHKSNNKTTKKPRNKRG